MAHGQVTITYKTTAISTKAVPPGKFSPLSVLDRAMQNKRLHILLYYPSFISREAGDLMTRKLILSLSEVLSSFPIMTGRLLKNGPEGQWMVKCNDAGLRMVEARAKGSVEEWLEKVDRENELKLVHWEDMCDVPYYWSTFYVQLTEFERGGLAIGLSCTHLLADPISASVFIKAWADTTLLGDKMRAPPLFHPLPSRRPFNTNIDHKPYTELINHYKSLSEKIEPMLSLQLDHRAVTLAFSHEMVESCMVMAKTPGASKGLVLVTPFQALAALFWVCISKVKGNKFGLANMSLCVDMRKTLGLDKCFFGNCMVYNKVHDHESLEQNDDALLSKAANAIEEVAEKMDRDGVMDLIEWLEIKDRDQSLPVISDHDHLICANLEGVELYEAVFENGLKPIRASCYIEPVAGEGQVMILPLPTATGESSSSSGRAVMVILPEDEVVKLLEDVLLLQFAPDIL